MQLREFESFGSDAPPTYDGDWMRDVLRQIATALTEHSRAINAVLGFGDGTDPDNIAGKWIAYSTNAVADTEDVLTHDLGVVPIGIIIVRPPQTGFITRGPTAWTTSQLFLKCSAAAQTATIFVLPPSHGIITG